MNPNDTEQLVREIVSTLVEDLEDRSGFRQVWQRLDLYDKGQMVNEWRSLVRTALDHAKKSE